MRLVERMDMVPHACLYCGAGNVPNAETGEMGPFVDFERDTQWGDDSVYLCMRCVDEVGALCGLISKGQAEELEDQIKRLKSDVHDLKSERDSHERRLRTIAAGTRTVKRVKKAVA